MILLLTILSVIAVLVFLSVLALGLLMIQKTLRAAQGNLEQIAMGLRAIEQETKPLRPGLLKVRQQADAGAGKAKRLHESLLRTLDSVQKAASPTGGG